MMEIVSKLNRLQITSIAVGILGIVFCCVGFIVTKRAFCISYLWAFLFWMSLSLGCFYGAAIHYLTAGRWGLAARRIFEAGFMTLPLMLILVVPIFFGLHELYPWARPEEISSDKVLQQRAHFQNFSGFVLRTIIFFVIWIFIASRLRKWSLQQDSTGDLAPTMKIRALAGPAIAIIPLTASFAFVDWAMSIEPDWFSTIFPVIILAGQMLIALAFAAVLLAWTQKSFPLHAANEKTFQDLASLLLAFVMFWTYLEFSQILIIYSENLPHEISWYLNRIKNNWVWLVGLIALFHFFLPFFLLLFRKMKRNFQLLAAIAILIFAIHAVEIFWVIAPTFYPQIEIHWTDFAAWFGVGGIWLGIFARNLKRHSLLARNDPRQENLIAEIAHAK